MEKTKKNIAVVCGGDSSEYIISLKSGKTVYESVDTALFRPWMVEIRGAEWKVYLNDEQTTAIDKSDFTFINGGKKITFDYAYIIIHGTPGEDGILQAYFDLLHIPYSSCGVQSSALTFNKYFCSNYLRAFGILMAPSILVRKNAAINPDDMISSLGLPVFVKPNAGGSSFGITKVKTREELITAIGKAWNENSDALVEAFIDGREFTCGLARMNGDITVFPATEVIPQKEFFDSEAKYIPGMTDEITPARLTPQLACDISRLSQRIYDLCLCEGVVRIDYILKDNCFYFLEVNTVPGMTGTSFIPQQAAAAGIDLKSLITNVILEKLK